MIYTILKTPAKYNIYGKDTYSVMVKAKPTIKGASANWDRAVQKSFDTLEDAEQALNEIKKPRDKVIECDWGI